MENERLIPVEQLCTHYEIQLSFLQALTEFGLVNIITVEKKQYVDPEQLRHLEKMIRLHYELDINLEGIDAIGHLLQKMERMEEELRTLRNQLHRRHET